MAAPSQGGTVIRSVALESDCLGSCPGAALAGTVNFGSP